MAENVKVIVRCRPINKKEVELNCQCVVKMDNCVIETWDPNDGPALSKQFTFDSVYDLNSSTETIYNDICYPLIESVLEGYNSTVFVYGQTGCGKSFTMEGTRPENGRIIGSEKGIIPRAFEHIFEAISVTTGAKYLALVSYLEIYNEQIRDLLLPCEKRQNTPLSLKEITNEGVIVSGLSTHPVHNVQECEQLLSIGSKNRAIGATLMNQTSSRSHSIFTISLEQMSRSENTNNNEIIRKGKLNLVDLAGSERQAKTGASGDRLKEATKINLSLSALGNVISALVDGKAKHIPYRDSKLTRLLQDSLGGNTRTLMIACISPSSRDYVETLSTLRYANRAKNIHNRPRVNEDPKDTMLRKYQEEIERLRSLLESSKSDTLSDLPPATAESMISDDDTLDEKRGQLIEEYEHEMTALRNLNETERTEKESILKQMENIKREYDASLEKLNREIEEKNVQNLREKQQKIVSKDEIMKRLQTLKDALIGGERANDKEISERRKRKKLAAERRLNTIAHVLAKMDINEDREILQNQYKDISSELQMKTDMLRKYKHRVRSLEKEILDIQSEFEEERQDYLEMIRKQDKNVKLFSQISEKISGTLKKECNYSDLDTIKEQAVWLDDSQKYKLPDIVVQRTKLPPAVSIPTGRVVDIQTAPARLESDSDTETYEQQGVVDSAKVNRAPDKRTDWLMQVMTTDSVDAAQAGNPYVGSTGSHYHRAPSSSQSDSSLRHSSSHPTTPNSDDTDYKKLEKSMKEDIAGNYFIKPKRAAQLLNQSKSETSKAFNTWRDFAKKNKLQAGEPPTQNGLTVHSSPNVLSNSYGGISSLWLNGNGMLTPDTTYRKPLRLEALPTVEKRRKSHKLNTLDLI